MGFDSGICFDDGCGFTGWVRSNYTIIAAGSYIIEFGVVNWNNTQYDSGVAIDTVTLNQGPLDLIFRDRFEE